jgi:hypothetical protein
MFSSIGDNASARKQRLFMCACGRILWHIMTDERSRRAIEIAEQFAEGTVSEFVLSEAWINADIAFEFACTDHNYDEHEFNPRAAVCNLAALISDTRADMGEVATAGFEATPAPKNQYPSYADLLRDIFGNPFRPVAFAADWRTSDAVAIARTMYESRDFGAMPILADALQDAGCDNEDILSHCRDTALTHVRGCWVVDAVLGKE